VAGKFPRMPRRDQSHTPSHPGPPVHDIAVHKGVSLGVVLADCKVGIGQESTVGCGKPGGDTQLVELVTSQGERIIGVVDIRGGVFTFAEIGRCVVALRIDVGGLWLLIVRLCLCLGYRGGPLRALLEGWLAPADAVLRARLFRRRQANVRAGTEEISDSKCRRSAPANGWVSLGKLDARNQEQFEIGFNDKTTSLSSCDTQAVQILATFESFVWWPEGCKKAAARGSLGSGLGSDP